MKKVWTVLRRILKIFLIALLVLVACGIVIDFYTEVIGIRGEKVLRRVKTDDVKIELDRVKFGLIRNISVHNIEVTQPTQVGNLHVTVGHLYVVPRWYGLLNANMLCARFTISDARAVLYMSDLLPIQVSDVQISGVFSDDGQDCTVKIIGKLNGINLHISCQLQNCHLLLDAIKRGQREAISEELAKKVFSEINSFLQKCDFGSDDARIRLSLTVDCKELSLYQGSGTFTLSNSIVGGVMLDKLRGSLNYRRGRLALTDVIWMMGGSSMIRGKAEYDVKRGLLNASYNGTLATDHFLNVVGVPLPKDSLRFLIPRNIAFSGMILDSPLSLEKLRTEANVVASNFRQGRLKFSSLDGKISLDNRKITFGDTTLHMDDAYGSFLSGNGFYDFGAGKFAMQASGKVNLIDNLGISLPYWLRMGRSHLTEIDVSIPESDADISKLTADLHFNHTGMHLKNSSIDSLSGTLQWRGNQLHIKNIGAKLLGSRKNVLRLEGIASVDGSLEHILSGAKEQVGDISLDWNLEMDSRFRQKGWSEGLKTKGKITYSPKENTLSASGAGSVFFDAFFNTYLSEMSFDGRDSLALIFCTDHPFEFTYELPTMKIREHVFRLGGKLHAKNAGFDTFKAKEATCDYEVTEKHTRFYNLKGVLPDGGETSMNMELVYFPFAFIMTDLRLKGNPSVASAFILNDYAKRVYTLIWRDLNWDAEKKPDILISNLTYLSDDMDTAWTLVLNGNIKASNVKYGQLSSYDVSGDVKLTLPGTLDITNIHLKSNEAEAVGSFTMQFDNLTQCSFSIQERRGALDLGRLFNEIDSSWAEIVRDLRFDKNTMLTCNGSFVLGQTSGMKFNGKVKSKQCFYRNFHAEEVDGLWSFENNSFSLNMDNATFAGGKCRMTGYFDFARKNGELLFRMEKMDCTSFIDYFLTADDSKSRPKLPGKVDLELNLNFRHKWAGHPYYVTGNGRLSMREADLWQVPVVSGLGKFLSLTTFNLFGPVDLGKISEVDADLSFAGTRLVIEDMSTNGTIIALSGYGEYSWELDQIHFVASGEALRNMGLLSWLFKPLSWAFDAELTGTLRKNEWRTRTALRKIFLGN